jgi:hypothetical protein
VAGGSHRGAQGPAPELTERWTRLNNDLVLRIRDRAVLEAYGRNFTVIRDRHAKLLKRVP